MQAGGSRDQTFRLVHNLLYFLRYSHPKAYSAWYSQLVSHPSTNKAQPCLASKSRRDRACSGMAMSTKCPQLFTLEEAVKLCER